MLQDEKAKIERQKEIAKQEAIKEAEEKVEQNQEEEKQKLEEQIKEKEKQVKVAEENKVKIKAVLKVQKDPVPTKRGEKPKKVNKAEQILKVMNNTKPEEKPIEQKTTKPEKPAPKNIVIKKPKVISEAEKKEIDLDVDEAYPRKEFSRDVKSGVDPSQLVSIDSNLIRKPSLQLLKIEEDFSRNPDPELFKPLKSSQ